MILIAGKGSLKNNYLLDLKKGREFWLEAYLSFSHAECNSQVERAILSQ